MRAPRAGVGVHCCCRQPRKKRAGFHGHGRNTLKLDLIVETIMILTLSSLDDGCVRLKLHLLCTPVDIDGS